MGVESERGVGVGGFGVGRGEGVLLVGLGMEEEGKIFGERVEGLWEDGLCVSGEDQ